MTTGAIQMSSNDNVATSLTDLTAGCRVIIRSKLGHEERIVIAAEDIPFGHKIAIRDIGEGEDIVKYGHRIGEATELIAAGKHVHVRNLRSIRGRAAAAEVAAE
jgi:altronate dehydratase small subunit